MTPLALSVTLYLVTKSPVSLALALISPLVLLLTRALTKRTGAKKWLAENAVYRDTIADLLEQASAVHQRERNEWLRAHPEAFILGSLPAPSGIRLETGATSARARQLRRRIEINPVVPFGLDRQKTKDGPVYNALTISFGGVLARQIARRWHLVQSDGTDEEDAQTLQHLPGPQERDSRREDSNHAQTVLDRVDGTVMVRPERPLCLQLQPFRPQLAERERRQRLARAQLNEQLEQARARDTALPDPTDRSRLSAVLGVHNSGLPVVVELVAEGPHTLIAGTTGSGKSELLQTLVAALAERYSPKAVQFLLLDFKGGTAMQHLAKLPHCLEMLTDLEQEQVSRTVGGLSAELRRRERLLRAYEINDIAELQPETELSRLLIVVDEFATLITELPELHSVFTDIAARGRALGMHLVIATQRPAGVIRDALAANCALRFCLRVTDSAESHAVLGTHQAATFRVDELGACAHSVSGRVSPPWKVTRTLPERVAELVNRWSSAVPAATPWRGPLPKLLSVTEWNPREDGAPYLGLSDDPHNQSQERVAYIPYRDGPLLVLGGRGAGKTNLCELIASQWNSGDAQVTIGRHGTARTERIRFSDADPERAWDQLHALLEALDMPDADETARLWVFDDIDRAVQRLSPEHASAIVAMMSRALREVSSRDALVLTMNRIPAQFSSMLNGFGNRLFLRASTQEDHVLWGLTAKSYHRSAPAGRALYRDLPVQLALTQSVAKRSPVECLELPDLAVLAVMTSRPGMWQALGEQMIPDAVLINIGKDEPKVPEASRIIIVGDSEDWLLNASIMLQLRNQAGWIFDKCSTAEIKQVVRKATLPPPTIQPNTALFWNSEAGFRRVRLEHRRAP